MKIPPPYPQLIIQPQLRYCRAMRQIPHKKMSFEENASTKALRKAQ